MSNHKHFSGESENGSVQDALVAAVNSAKSAFPPDKKFNWEIISIRGIGNYTFEGNSKVQVGIIASGSDTH